MNQDTQSAKGRAIPSIILGIVCFVLLTLFDQLTKRWAVLHLYGQDPIVLIKNVFQFYYLENHGAALGILQGRSVVFVIITVVVLVLILFFYTRLPFEKKYRILRVFMVFIAAGAVGNFIDRIARGYVVDFLYFYGINFPVFNVADCYVTICVIVLILVLLIKYRDADFVEMGQSLRFKKKEKKEA